MSIDSLYADVIAKLTQQGHIQSISIKLLSLTRNDARVLYAKTLVEELNVLPKPLQVKKSELMSTHYRNLGNQHFQKSNDYEAWQYYNLSLLHAPVNTDTYSIAIANRSAVLCSLKKFKESITDIEKVFAMKYPEKLRKKLMKRQSICRQGLTTEEPDEYIQQKNKIDEILDMQGSSHSSYVCASSKLEVKYDKHMGRHVVANEDIAPGEVLAKEEPYFTLLLKSQCLFSCSYCLSRNANLYPCHSCCFSLYCSMDCRKKAWKDYHNIECAMLPTLDKMEFTKLELLALRTVIKARSEQLNWESFYKTIEEAESHMNTPLHGHINIDGKWICSSKYYPAIHTLATNLDKRSISDIFQKAVTAVVFIHLLKEQTCFLKSTSESEDEKVLKCVAGLLLHHIMTSPTNMHGISSNNEDSVGNYVDEVSLASAPYAFLSLLNHSCSPNVVRFSKLGTGQVTLFSLRPIKKGMQLFDNYGFHHALQEREKRQKSLSFQYKFNCMCEACTNDWPLYLKLKPATNLASGVLKTKERLLNSNSIEKLQKGDLAMALKLFKPLCVLLSVFERYAPCVEMADCQEALKQCIVILQGLVPFGYSKLVEWSANLPEKETTE